MYTYTVIGTIHVALPMSTGEIAYAGAFAIFDIPFTVHASDSVHAESLALNLLTVHPEYTRYAGTAFSVDVSIKETM